MKSSFLSIGIPVFNQADLIADAIDSLLRQSLPPSEIVVSDNHSTDHLCDVLSRYRSKVKIIKPTSHLSMPDHWNFLISNMRSGWVSLLSADDIALKNFCHDFDRAIAYNTDAVLVRGPYCAINADGLTVATRSSFMAASRRSFPNNFYEQIQNTKTSFAAFAINKDAWSKVGGFPSDLSLSSDWGLWLKLAPLGLFVTVKKPVAKYRVDYRPDINRERASAWLSDALKIRLILIPSISSSVTAKLINEYSANRNINWVNRNKKALSVRDLKDADAFKILASRYLKYFVGLLLSKFYRLRTIK